MADIQSPGTAVQSAVTADGQTWEYDNEGGSWVNLNTGQSLKPGEFAAFAGRSSNAAINTAQLADEMRREEAALTRQVLPPRGPTPVPTSVGAQGFSVPAAAPVVSPETLARVAVQRPTPTVRPPPGVQDWVQAYTKGGQLYGDRMMQDMSSINRLQATMDYQRRVKSGEDPQKVLSELWPMLMAGGRAGAMPRIPVAPAPKRYNVHGVGLTDETGKVLVPTPPSPPKDVSDRYNYAEFTASQKREAELRKEMAKATDLDVKGQLVGAIAREVAMQKKLRPAAPAAPAAAIAAPTPAAKVVPPPMESPKGREIKDKQGKTWIYTGTSPNPLTDRNPDHWSEK